LKTETGELVISDLSHQDKAQVRAFYQQFTSPMIVGLEASGYSPWFETLLEQLGGEVWLVMPLKSGAELVGAKRTIGATPNSFGI
jgi:transposase